MAGLEDECGIRDSVFDVTHGLLGGRGFLVIGCCDCIGLVNFVVGVVRLVLTVVVGDSPIFVFFGIVSVTVDDDFGVVGAKCAVRGKWLCLGARCCEISP